MSINREAIVGTTSFRIEKNTRSEALVRTDSYNVHKWVCYNTIYNRFASINGWAESVHFLLSNPDATQKPNVNYSQG